MSLLSWVLLIGVSLSVALLFVSLFFGHNQACDEDLCRVSDGHLTRLKLEQLREKFGDQA